MMARAVILGVREVLLMQQTIREKRSAGGNAKRGNHADRTMIPIAMAENPTLLFHRHHPAHLPIQTMKQLGIAKGGILEMAPDTTRVVSTNRPRVPKNHIPAKFREESIAKNRRDVATAAIDPHRPTAITKNQTETVTLRGVLIWEIAAVRSKG